MIQKEHYSVSVIIPVYNLEKYISRCLDSLINQKNFSNYQIIIVDDGSTDDSSKIIKKYEEKYSNILYYYQKNAGVSAARNLGISKIDSEYVFFIDGDDYVSSEYIDTLLEKAKSEHYDMVVGNYELVWDSGKRVSYRKNKQSKEYNQKEAIKEVLVGGNIGVNIFDKLYKSDIVKRINFDKQFKISEDLLFLYTYLKNCSSIYGLYNDGYCYYQRSNSVMHLNFDSRYFDAIKVAEIIKNDEFIKNAELNNCANALVVYKKYKTLERIYKSKKQKEYKSIIKEYKREIKKLKNKSAYKLFSTKRFCGFLLMKYFTPIYIIMCKIMNV